MFYSKLYWQGLVSLGLKICGKYLQKIFNSTKNNPTKKMSAFSQETLETKKKEAQKGKVQDNKGWPERKKPERKGEQSARDSLVERRVDLVACKEELLYNQDELAKQLEEGTQCVCVCVLFFFLSMFGNETLESLSSEFFFVVTDKNEMQRLEEEISPAAKRNFELEKNLMLLDKQIERFIQNMISITQLNEITGSMIDPETNTPRIDRLLDGKKKSHYEKLFHLLRKEDKYLACLSYYVETKDTNDFVKTVVFDLYGNQYDSHEERLLLTLFRQ
ncbi:RasGTPase-activating protein, partial [Reticulomyxa filosa]